MNTGSLFLFAVFYSAFRVFVYFLRKIAYYNPQYVWLYRKLRTDTSLSMIFCRFMLESYFEFLVSALLSIELAS